MRVFLILFSVILLSGCTGPSINSERVSPYRPDIAGRDLTAARVGGGLAQSNVQPSNVPDSGTNANDAASSSSAIILRHGDRIMINFLGVEPVIRIEDVVDEQGNISLPYIGMVRIGDKSTDEAEKFIEKLYIEGGFYKQIVISVVRQIEGEYFVQGETNNKMGKYPLQGATTLLQAISTAGGFTVFANQKKVQLNRNGKITVYNLKEMADGEVEAPMIEPNDVIIVPKSRW